MAPSTQGGRAMLTWKWEESCNGTRMLSKGNPYL